MPDMPLGPILDIVGNEAITKPNKAFVAKGATVITLDNKRIGKLDLPIGRVDHPYQVIKLDQNNPKLNGELVIAKLSKRNKSKRRRKKGKR